MMLHSLVAGCFSSFHSSTADKLLQSETAALLLVFVLRVTTGREKFE